MMLDAVTEGITSDEFKGAEDGQDPADNGAVEAVNELAHVQSTVMATFEARLMERDAAIQVKLQAQYDTLAAEVEACV